MLELADLPQMKFCLDSDDPNTTMLPCLPKEGTDAKPVAFAQLRQGDAVWLKETEKWYRITQVIHPQFKPPYLLLHEINPEVNPGMHVQIKTGASPDEILVMLDGRPIGGLTALSFSAGLGERPTVTMSLMPAIFDIDLQGVRHLTQTRPLLKADGKPHELALGKKDGGVS